MPPVLSLKMTGSQPDAVRHLESGEQLLFGSCGCGSCHLDLVVQRDEAGSVTGRARAGPDHWRLENLGGVPLAVEDLEHPLHLVTLPPRRWAVIPFELSQIVVWGRAVATAFGPEPAPPEPAGSPCAQPALPGDGAPVDVGSTYFATLVALCEPRLRGAAYLPLPTSAEIARSLARQGLLLTPRAVDAHIDHLVEKLRLRPSDESGTGRRTWRKEALASVAMRQGLVRPEHLPQPIGPDRRSSTGS